MRRQTLTDIPWGLPKESLFYLLVNCLIIVTSINPAMVPVLPNHLQAATLYAPTLSNPYQIPNTLLANQAHIPAAYPSQTPTNIGQPFPMMAPSLANQNATFPRGASLFKREPDITYNLPVEATRKIFPTSDMDFSLDSLPVYSTGNQNTTVILDKESQLYNRPITSPPVEESAYETSTPLMMDPPPDLISDNLEFKRTMRKWTSAKEKDDDFFEEEQRYLKSLQAKRMR